MATQSVPPSAIVGNSCRRPGRPTQPAEPLPLETLVDDIMRKLRMLDLPDLQRVEAAIDDVRAGKPLAITIPKGGCVLDGFAVRA